MNRLQAATHEDDGIAQRSHIVSDLLILDSYVTDPRWMEYLRGRLRCTINSL